MKKLKKSWAIYIGALALVLAIALVSVVGFAYSKYTDNAGNGSETATVSKFGVTLSGTGSLFEQQYATTDSTTAGAIGYTVDAVSGDTLAPGTSSATPFVLSASVDGTNEVAVKLDFDLSGVLNGWTVGANDYAYTPVDFTIKRTVDGVVNYFNGTAWGTDVATTKVFPTLTAEEQTVVVAPKTEKAISYEISWAWDFENADDYYRCNTVDGGDVVGAIANSLEGKTAENWDTIDGNALDTILGKAATANVVFSASVTATQID